MVFNIFKKLKKKSVEDFLKDKDILTIKLEKPLDCLCDFTYNFIWQSNFDYNQKVVDDITYKDLVEHLKNKGVVYIKGDVGKRFCSSMGADLKHFGGKGGKIEVGTVIIDGNIDTRFGISMVSGTVYVNEKSTIKEPIGNVIEVESDIKGYRKFISITEFVEKRHNEKLLKPNKFKNDELIINDGIVRDTVGARLEKDATIVVNGNVDLSTGILMKKGKVIVNGNAGKNTGAVLRGGCVIVKGNAGDFTAIEMKKGLIIVDGNAGKYLGAKKKGGIIYARDGSPIPPTKKYLLSEEDKKLLNKLGFFGDFYKFQ